MIPKTTFRLKKQIFITIFASAVSVKGKSVMIKIFIIIYPPIHKVIIIQYKSISSHSLKNAKIVAISSTSIVIPILKKVTGSS